MSIVWSSWFFSSFFVFSYLLRCDFFTSRGSKSSYREKVVFENVSAQILWQSISTYFSDVYDCKTLRLWKIFSEFFVSTMCSFGFRPCSELFLVDKTKNWAASWESRDYKWKTCTGFACPLLEEIAEVTLVKITSDFGTYDRSEPEFFRVSLLLFTWKSKFPAKITADFGTHDTKRGAERLFSLPFSNPFLKKSTSAQKGRFFCLFIASIPPTCSLGNSSYTHDDEYGDVYFPPSSNFPKAVTNGMRIFLRFFGFL